MSRSNNFIYDSEKEKREKYFALYPESFRGCELRNPEELLKEIEREIRSCRKCDLWKTKENYVPGEGNPLSKIVFIGEAPGKEEDRQGRPFVGRAGKLLESYMRDYLGLERKDVFICNILKCRPPGNRDPQEDEIHECFPYLQRQLQAIQPQIIVCLGRFATGTLFDHLSIPFSGISRVRGKLFRIKAWSDAVLIPVYHPAAVLYRKQLEKEFSMDFEKIAELLNAVKNRKKLKESKLSDFI